jgi:hypothetical protein
VDAAVVVAVVEAEAAELEGWVEVAVAEAAVEHRSQGEDTAVVVAFLAHRTPRDHGPLQGQVLAGAAEWFRTGTSEGATLKAEDLK